MIIPDKCRMGMDAVRLVAFLLPLTSVLLVDSLRMTSESLPTVIQSAKRPGCPRKEDIHPCECLEIPRGLPEDNEAVETVAFCKTIRNAQVLQNAMKGMQGHTIDFMVLDSCKLPPFPNGLFFNVGIKWMEIINSTIQMRENFFDCASNCW